MAVWFWRFFIYSLGGYGLEKWYAHATRAANQTRKCLLLLPLCPVYGLGLTAVLALPERWRVWPWILVSGAVVTTAVEYFYHWACQRFLGVQFWDYSGVPGNLRGRVCLPFTLAWGVLSAAALALFEPMLGQIIPLIPPWATLAAVMVLTADAVCSVQFLRKTHNPEGLHLRSLAGT